MDMRKILFFAAMVWAFANFAQNETQFDGGIHLKTDVNSIHNLLDENGMDSNRADAVPTQKSTRAHVKAKVDELQAYVDGSFVVGAPSSSVGAIPLFASDSGKRLSNSGKQIVDALINNGDVPTSAAIWTFVYGIKLDDFATPDDNTDLNASTTRHGLLRKLNGNSMQVLNGDGDWITPSHANLSNIGTNTHPQIDTHLSSTSNPHTVTADQLLNGILPAARLPAPTASTKGGVQLSGSTAHFYRGDGTWTTPAGGGDVTASGTTAPTYQYQIPYWNEVDKQLNAHGYTVDAYADGFTNDDAFLPSSKLVKNAVEKVVSVDENITGAYASIPFWTGNNRELFHGGYAVDFMEPIANDSSHIPSSKAVLQEIDSALDASIPKKSIFIYSQNFISTNINYYPYNITAAQVTSPINQTGCVAYASNPSSSNKATITIPGSSDYFYEIRMSISYVAISASLYINSAYVFLSENYDTDPPITVPVVYPYESYVGLNNLPLSGSHLGITRFVSADKTFIHDRSGTVTYRINLAHLEDSVGQDMNLKIEISLTRYLK